MNEHLQNEGKALGESSPGELPKETTFGFEKQCRVMKTETHRYAGFETKKNAENEDEGVWKEISNFTMDLVGTERRVDTEKKMVTYTIKLTPATDVASPMDSLVTVVEPGELTPMANFEKFVLSRGRYQFWGRDLQYKRVRAMMMDETVPEIRAKDVAGYDPKLDIWFAHNGAVSGSGKVHRAEPSGEIIIAGDHYKLAPQDETALPRLPKMAFDCKYKGDAVYDNILWPFMDLLAEMYGPVTELAIGWVFSMVYGHQFYTLTGNHPMLFIHGPKGQGKTQLGYMLMGAFGVTAKPNPIQQLSITSLYTLVNNASNIPAWLDEYKPNAFDRDIQEAIKNNYDRFSREVGTLDVFKTKVRRARSTFMITGEYEPEDHATKSRTVAVCLEPRHDEEKFRRAQAYAANLSAVTLDLLKHRDRFWPAIQNRYEKLLVEFRKEVCDSRIISNYAKVCAVLDVIRVDLRRTDRVKRWMTSKSEDTASDNPAVQVLEKLPYLMKSARVFIPFRINWKRKLLCVQAKELLYAYQNSDRGRVIPVNSFIGLGKDAKILVPGHSDKAVPAGVISRSAESGPVKTVQRCFIFDMTNIRVLEVAKELEAHFGKDVGRDDDQAADE